MSYQYELHTSGDAVTIALSGRFDGKKVVELLDDLVQEPALQQSTYRIYDCSHVRELVLEVKDLSRITSAAYGFIRKLPQHGHVACVAPREIDFSAAMFFRLSLKTWKGPVFREAREVETWLEKMRAKTPERGDVLLSACAVTASTLSEIFPFA